MACNAAYPGRVLAVSAVPAPALLVAWGNGAITGAVSLDEATERITGGDRGHRVVGLPGEPTPVGVSLALGRLRALGVTGLRLVLPVPGDPTGLPGPPAFNETAIEVGHAAIAVSPPGGHNLGLLELAGGAWEVSPVDHGPSSSLSLADAEDLLQTELRACTHELVRLDVARWNPEVVSALRQQSRPADPVLPPSYPPRAHHLLALAERLGVIVALGSATDGAAVTAAEMSERSGVLRRLGAAVRRATEAACTGV